MSSARFLAGKRLGNIKFPSLFLRPLVNRAGLPNSSTRSNASFLASIFAIAFRRQSVRQLLVEAVPRFFVDLSHLSVLSGRSALSVGEKEKALKSYDFRALSLVDLKGFEPTTLRMRTVRSPNWYTISPRTVSNYCNNVSVQSILNNIAIMLLIAVKLSFSITERSFYIGIF